MAYLELLLKKANNPLTPDRIRYALSGVHTMIFEEARTQKIGKMRSSLSQDGYSIFSTLGISLDRSTIFDQCCV